MKENGVPIIFDSSDGQKLRINTINTYLKKKFGGKVVKLSLDGGFTCPNRDGSKGTTGCAFCSASGSGDMATDASHLEAAIESQIALLSKKWPESKYNTRYIAYFQSHTNTYAPIGELRTKFYAALNHPKISGIAIATRPDCIDNDVVALLSEIREKYFMWVELGLQTIHRKTAKAMNLCYTVSDYDAATAKLRNKKIPTVAHLILGLPGESREMMLESVKHVCSEDLFGLKLHMLNLVKGSHLAVTHPNYVSFQSIDDYVDTLISCLEIIPPNVVLHRISGDAPRATLISPEWSYEKRTILNTIHKEMALRNTWQGKLIP